MYPTLVEPTIRIIMTEQLNKCNKTKFEHNTLVFNLVTGLLLISIISIILYITYKGKQDFRSIREREDKKRNFILSKVNFYQKMKTKEFTNMPI